MNKKRVALPGLCFSEASDQLFFERTVSNYFSSGHQEPLHQVSDKYH